MMRVADYAIDQLAALSVGHIFMVTGRGVLYLSDAVAKNPAVTGISLHHEQSCAYAAQGYAMRRGGVGACLVSTGCGATNAITGVLNAWQDGVPVVFLSGQHMLNETAYHTGLPVRTYGQQEANIIELVRPITKYAVMLERAEDAACQIEEALFRATEGRKGPVWIDIPLDIQNARIEPDQVRHFEGVSVPLAPTDDDMADTAQALRAARRPVLLIGSGIRASGSEELVRRLIGQLKLPVVFDTAATDVCPDENECSMGTIGAMGGSRAGNFTIQNADLVISIGCRMNSAQVGEDPDAFARDAKIIAVDIDEAEARKSTVQLDRFIHADAALFLQALDRLSLPVCSEGWQDTCRHWKSIFPKCERWSRESDAIDLYHLADCIGNSMQPGETILSDAGIEELVIPSVAVKKDGVRIVHPASQGCMGFALGAAAGSWYAGEGQNVIAVIGDGSVMMNLQELQSIRYLGIPLKLFVVNNDCYAVIRQRQKDLFRTRTIGTDAANGVSCADFESVASAFDLPYIRLEGNADLQQQVDRVLACEGPVLCEVIARKEQPFLRNAYAVGEKHRLIKRHLEDQAPFMDRTLFHQEMIVQPTDTWMEG
ncbi:MAG: thiamine pyrophosphate-binding protein [Butyrivibrio sp.]|nr:thiamine pyrophosphate-binding protein [Butyrivibrio sp.]